MTTFQIIGLIVVALIGLYIFYCIYDLEKFNKKKKRRRKNKVLTVTLLFVALFAGENVMAQWTGEGTQGNPYQIQSKADLNTLATNVNNGTGYSGTYFLLKTNLNYSYSYAWNSNNANATENNYTAIGAFGNSFKGHFDGGGHTISGIRIYKSGTSQTSDELQGVFGNLSGGSVRNLTVADASITGYQQVGAIAGCNNGTIEDCVVASNVGIYRVTNGADKHGGIIGANSNGNVRRCTSSATIITHPKIGNVINAKCGGIIGYQSQGQAVHHYVENNTALNVVVQSGQSVGGAIIGERYNSNTNYLHLTNNYYRNCTVNNAVNATNVGLGNPAGDMNGARSVHALTLGTNITATGDNVVIGNTTYYVSTANITLEHTNHAGYYVSFSYNDGTVHNLAGNTFPMPAADATVSASFSPVAYYVHFDKNNDDATGTMGDQQFTYGQAQNLSANAFTREDYVFSGWNTQANGGGTSYTDGQSVSNLSTESNGIVNLYAQWRLRIWQGSGVEDDPFIINSTAALDLLAYAVNNNVDNNQGFANKYFRQTENLTYDGTTNNYTPVGNNSRYFKGHYDGGGFTISGINVTGSDNYIGVFGHVSQGSIENVVVANSTFTGNNNVGGIVGHTYGGSVSNCKVMSDVTIGTSSSSAYYHGGIVGYLREAEITGCLSMATLTDPNNVGSDYGGIAGTNYNGTINNCIYTGGSVTAHYYCTAIAQRMGKSFVFTNNYYYNCTVNGETTGVGVNGENGENGEDIDGARHAHTITLGENIALVGDQTTYSLSGLTAIGNAVLCHTVGSTTTILSGALHTVTLSYTGTIPEGFSLVYNDGTDHPFIGNAFIMPDADITVGISNAFPTIPGMGTENDPFIISNTAQLNLLAEMVHGISIFQNKYFKLGADLNYNPNELTDGNNYTAIGIYYDPEYPIYYFDGTFDGDGHIISGIRISQPVYNPQALFGCVGPNGTVKNVTLIDAVIAGNDAVGGIVGNNRGSVKNCRVINATITGNYWVGGIVGNSGVTIENCLVLNTAIIYSNTENPVGGAIFGVQQAGDAYNNYYHNCTVNGVASNIGCGVGFDTLSWTSGDITMNNGAIQAYTLTWGSHITLSAVPTVTFNNINYYTEGTVVTIGASAVNTITSAKLTYGGNDYNIEPVGGVYSFDMPAADATVTATWETEYVLYSGNIVEGEYLIVYDGYAMSNAIETHKFKGVAVTANDGVITTDNDAIVWRIVPSAMDENYWVIYNAQVEKYAAVYNTNGGTLKSIAKMDRDFWSIDKELYGYEFRSKEVPYYLSPNGNDFFCPMEPSGLTLYKKVAPPEYYPLTIDGYHGSDYNDKWAFIASPVTDEGGIIPAAVGNIFSTTEYDLYRLNPSNARWENYKNGSHTLDFRLVNGQGYLYATKDTKTLSFTGTFNTDNSKDVALQQGWNLIGNPFITPAYVNRPYYKMNQEGTGVEIVADYAGNRIPVCTGVVVSATGTNESVTFSKTAPEAATGNNGNLNIVLSQVDPSLRGGTTKQPRTLDNAIVSFDEGSELGKFYFGEQDANIYIPQDGKEYAIVSVGGSDAMHCVSTEIPLNFKAKKNGEYTLSVETANSQLSTANYLHLIDNLTGADIDLLTTPSYTFTAKTTDYASRFKLVFANQNDDENEDFAFISNGEIIINGEGTLQAIDMLGRVIVCRDAMHCVSTAGMAPGVYVLRLINGEDVKTQKIIIKK